MSSDTQEPKLQSVCIEGDTLKLTFVDVIRISLLQSNEDLKMELDHLKLSLRDEEICYHLISDYFINRSAAFCRLEQPCYQIPELK